MYYYDIVVLVQTQPNSASAYLYKERENYGYSLQIGADFLSKTTDSKVRTSWAKGEQLIAGFGFLFVCAPVPT